jgi:segregation and condensation protein A
MPYEVSTAAFEGPFDLLLHLIAKQEVDIYEISLATIVDEYLAAIVQMPAVDLDLATEFLLIAATLIELKSRRLLPGSGDLELDEEFAIFEQRDLLLARLLECKTFKDAAAALHRRMQAAARSVPRTAGPEEPFASLEPDPLSKVSLAQLAAAGRRALTPKPEPVVDLDHVAPVRASVRDAIETVLALLPPSGWSSFRSLTTGADARLEVIVRFLAVLELYKRGVVDIEQLGTFAELRIRADTGPQGALDLTGLDLEGLDEWGDDEVDVRDGGEIDVTDARKDAR